MKEEGLLACIVCSARRLACGGEQPSCSGCRSRSAQCAYTWTLGPVIYKLFPLWERSQDIVQPSTRTKEVGRGEHSSVHRCGTKKGDLVALKVLFDQDIVRSQRLDTFLRKAFTWSRLIHPNLVPFLGVADNSEICQGMPSQLCLVSQWMTAGNIMQYLASHPSQDMLPLLDDVVRGLDYLHQQPTAIVHGGLKGSNILIYQQNGIVTACLSDYGLSSALECTDDATPIATSSIRWKAVERIVPQRFGFEKSSQAVTTHSDIFELWRTFLEILTRKPPFWPQGDTAVLEMVLSGQNPECPDQLDFPIAYELWGLMTAGWAPNRTERPTAADALYVLEQLPQIHTLKGTLDLASFLRMVDDLRFMRWFSEHLANFTRVSLDTTIEGNKTGIEVLRDVASLCTPSSWTSLHLRTTGTYQLEGALNLTFELCTPHHSFEHLSDLSLQTRQRWASNTTQRISVETIKRLAPKLRKLSLVDVPVDSQDMSSWSLEELAISTVRQVDSMSIPDPKAWHDVLQASPDLQRFTLQHSEEIHSSEILREKALDHDRITSQYGENSQMHALKMLRFISVASDSALRVMDEMSALGVECVILAHCRARPSSPSNLELDPLLELGLSITECWPNLRMLALRGMTLYLEVLLPLFDSLPRLEVLDIGEYNEQYRLAPREKTYLPRLAILRAVRDTMLSIEKITGRLFFATTLKLLEASKSPQASLLTRYQGYLTYGGRSEWYVTTDVGENLEKKGIGRVEEALDAGGLHRRRLVISAAADSVAQISV